jgi:cobalt-zinc-cadmium efflux system membrane fusion protein
MKYLAIVASTLFLILAAGCQRDSIAEPAKINPPSNEVWVTLKQIREAGISTAEVTEHPVGNALSTTGRVTFSDAKVSHIFSPVTGRVTSLLAPVGQRVGRGQALAIIQSPDVGTAVSDLQKAEADLAAAQRDYERQKELYDSHAAAQRDFEAAQSVYRKAKAERDRAAQKSGLLHSSTSGSSQQQYVLRSPIDGSVVARNVSPGMEVQGQYSGGTAPELFTVGNLDSVWVLADLFEVDLPRVKIGVPATVTVVSYPNRQFAGRVDWISGSLDPATRTAKVRCTIGNGERLLLPEMYATVSIATDTQQKLAVPRTAVVRLGDQMVAFVDRGASPIGERFERRIIAVDETEAGDYVPVLQGLVRGEKVVSSGAIILSGAER